MADELRVLATVANEAEAELIRGRLLSEGIHSVFQRTIGSGEWGGSGARNVLVNETDLERGRAVLGAGEVDEDELARLSDEAGPAVGS